ncbi:MAG TPA: DSD1 family PLP-dependent enzyme [Terriglobia bacterium]|nr:DSD1 family PLP-dependent enzyme [Terriglobia bacterium]
MLTAWLDHVRKTYSSAIGRDRWDLVTPALIMDLDVVRRNIQFMMQRLSTMKAKLRPHVKCQKSPELARLQVQAGAIGVCTATVWEAMVMSLSGVEDVMIANQVGGKEKISALAKAARNGHLTVAIDNPRNAEDLSNAVQAAGSKLDVVIEVDVGMGRGGVRSAEEAVTLAQDVAKLPGLRFRGVQGYEGHCMLEPDRSVRIQKAQAAMDYLGTAIDRLAAAGFECEVVSAGGTGTYDITGNNPRVTEIQAGSYVFMDNFHGNLVPGFSRALTVLGTVVIQHGKTVVLDAGRKSVGIDFVLPTMIDYPFYQARYFAEEHALFDVDDRCRLKLGDTVELTPGYAPTTVNLYDAYHVVEKDVVVDIWPIFPRGAGHGGLLTG